MRMVRSVLTIVCLSLSCTTCAATTVSLTRAQCRYLERLYPNSCMLDYGKNRRSEQSRSLRNDSGGRSGRSADNGGNGAGTAGGGGASAGGGGAGGGGGNGGGS